MRNGRRWNLVCLTAAILWLLFIWSNSLQTADVSSQLSLRVLEWFAPLLEQIGLPEEGRHTLIRKLAHVAEFVLVGLFWTAALSPRMQQPRRVRWMRRGLALLASLVIAVVDEFIQHFVLGRSCELRDVCIDLLGATLGVLTAMAAEMIFAGKRKRN